MTILCWVGELPLDILMQAQHIYMLYTCRIEWLI